MPLPCFTCAPVFGMRDAVGLAAFLAVMTRDGHEVLCGVHAAGG